jgi:hypothetical protein
MGYNPLQQTEEKHFTSLRVFCTKSVKQIRYFMTTILSTQIFYIVLQRLFYTYTGVTSWSRNWRACVYCVVRTKSVM